MAQKLKIKELVSTKLANNYGGWIYCGSCNQTIGYLCYVTYQSVIFEYGCKCGNSGSIKIEMTDGREPILSSNPLMTIHNRLCCPKDEAPLITILQQKLEHSSCKVICKNCNHQYSC